MQLTGKQIVEEGIITGYMPEAVQQQGMDLRLDKVRRFGTESGPNMAFGLIGHIPADGKTRLPYSTEVKPDILNGKETFVLDPGYYEVIFDEGCKMPNNRVMVFITRSSGVRCGVEIICGQFDAGFHTDHMGCFLRVHERCAIERHARIAQTRITTTEAVDSESMYNGQWQNDKQRETQNA